MPSGEAVSGLLVPQSLDVVRSLAWSPGVEGQGIPGGKEGDFSLEIQVTAAPVSPYGGDGECRPRNYNSHQLMGLELQLPSVPEA